MGSAHQHYVRVTPNSYADGVDDMPLPLPPTNPDANFPFPNAQYGDLPRPRDITDRIMAQDGGTDLPNGAGINEYLQFFGQFLTHDMTEAPLGAPQPGQTIDLDGLPFPFTRTPGDLVDGVREQENEETSFLDLSTVYGKTDGMLSLLRERDGGTATANLLDGDDGLLPTFAHLAAHHGRSVAEIRAIFDPLAPVDVTNQFVAGDQRINQNAPLITHHVTWMRNHNWHVDQLRENFPAWSEEELFQAARALNEAEWQTVVYNEYLPKMLGKEALAAYRGYSADVDPSIINEWATVAFRFGHDQSSNFLHTLGETGAETGEFTLSQAFDFANRAVAIRTNGSMDEWVRGQLSFHTQEIDGKVVDGNRNALFGLGLTVDLEVLDIQRGRDHGVGNYNELRDGLGLKTYGSFEAFARDNRLDHRTLTALKDVYGNDIDDLDSIVGGLLEKNFRDSQLGVTFHTLTVLQFENLRDGDRFFHLNRFENEPELLARIEDTSLSEILARTTGIDHLYRDAFAAHQRIGGTDAGNLVGGTQGHDLLIGLGGGDRLFGRAGRDDLYGDAGADRLHGERGDDLLDGGAGNDSLSGGDGRDTFRFEPGAGHDTVLDFQGRKDVVDLEAYDFTSFGEVRSAATNDRSTGSTIIELGGGDRVELAGVRVSELSASNFKLDDVAPGEYGYLIA